MVNCGVLTRASHAFSDRRECLNGTSSQSGVSDGVAPPNTGIPLKGEVPGLSPLLDDAARHYRRPRS
jgi:hypothetical protein